MNFKDLLSTIGKKNLKYKDLLRTSEWLERRDQILKRDEYYCIKCGLSGTIWHAGKYISFDKKKLVNLDFGDREIIADYPIIVEKKIQLHVHHNFYVLGRLPWEYLDSELSTLCNWCHWELHQTEEVKIYQEIENELKELSYHVCSRCNGAGILPKYLHIDEGICYKCEGVRYEELIGKTQSFWFR